MELGERETKESPTQQQSAAAQSVMKNLEGLLEAGLVQKKVQKFQQVPMLLLAENQVKGG